MSEDLSPSAPEGARAKLAAERAQRRNLEANCALDFLVWGDTHASGPHAERCVHVADGGAPCAREYDPLPYARTRGEYDEEGRIMVTTWVEAAFPAGTRMYEGTGIAALYGIPGGEAHAWQLAGWNVRKEQR